MKTRDKPGERPEFRRKKQIVVGMTILGLAAIMTSGCESAPDRRCVSKDGVVVSEEYCTDESQRHHHGGGGGGTYFFYYGGSGGYSPGSRVSGGSATPPSGYVAPSPHAGSGGLSSGHSGSVSGGSTVARGGFGGSVGSHGGFHGGSVGG